MFSSQHANFYASQTAFKRQKRFGVDDGLVTLRGEPKGDQPVFISYLYKELEKVITDILIRIREQYLSSEDYNYVTYVTIASPKIEAGINSKPFSIKSDLKRQAEEIIDNLYSFVQSNNDIRLNNRFMIYIKILSVPHTQERIRKGTLKPDTRINPDTTVGCYNTKCNLSNYYIHTLDEFYERYNSVFDQKCLLVAFIIGLFQNKLYEGTAESQQYKGFFNDSKLRPRVKHVNMVYKEYQSLKNDIDELKENEGPYKINLLEKLCKARKCQAIVFSEEEPDKILYMYPEKKDDSLPPIYLYVHESGRHFHISLVKRMWRYSKKLGFNCPHCKIISHSIKTYGHYCSKRNSCFACKRPIKENSDYINSLIKYCIPIENYNEKCTKCNVSLNSQSCKKNHNKFCHLGYFCDKCHRFERVSSDRIIRDNIKIYHDCSVASKCRSCFEPASPDHICKFASLSPQKDFDNLAFLNFIPMNTSQTTCYVCKNYKNCALHTGDGKHLVNDSGYVETNMCVFMCEEEKRENFVKYIWGPENYEIINNKLEIKYLPQIIKTLPLCTSRRGRFNKRRNSTLFKMNTEKLKQKKKTLVEQVLYELLTKKDFFNYTIITHSYIDLDLIYEALTTNGFSIGYLCKGSGFRSISIPERNVRFVPRDEYIPGTFNQVLDDLQISTPRHYFPLQYNHPTLYEFDGLIPVQAYFDIFDDSEDIIRKQVWYEQNRFAHIFSFIHDFYKYGENLIQLLAEAVIRFYKTSLEFQEEATKSFDMELLPGQLPIISPFTKSISQSSFAFNCLRFFCFDEDKVYVVPNPDGRKVQSSKFELEYINFLTAKHPNLIHAWSPDSKIRYKKFRKFAIPDAYDPQTNTVFFANGCFVHGHGLEECTILTEKQEKRAQNSKRGSFQNRLDSFDYKIKKFEKKFKDMNVEIIWECEWEEMKKTDKTLKSFQTRPVQKLVPRDALFGSFCELYNFNYDCNYDENISINGKKTKFYALDKISEYPAAAMNLEYPTGKCRSVIGDELEGVNFKNGKFHLQDTEIIGLAHVTVKAPNDLSHPYLPLRIKKRCILSLCKTCTEQQLDKNWHNYKNWQNSKRKNTWKNCKHSPSQRSWSATYTIRDINYAFKLGYEFDFHEILQYPSKEKLLRRYILLLSFERMRSSGFPPHIVEDKDKEEFCSEINNKMGFAEIKKKLTPDNMGTSSDKWKKNFYKSMMNKTLGKFSYNPNKYCKTMICKTREEVLKQYFAGNIQSIISVNEKKCLIQLEEAFSSSRVHRSSNVVIGAYTTSMAREIMHTDLTVVKNAGGKIFYLNCDSLFFTLDEDVPNPLPMGVCIGDYKNLYPGEVKSFCALSPKHYSVLYKAQTGVIKNKLVEVSKMSGVSMHKFVNDDPINHYVLDKCSKTLLKGEKCSIKSTQIRTKRSNNKVKYIESEFEFKFDIELRRNMSAPFDTFYNTQPFGFCYDVENGLG